MSTSNITTTRLVIFKSSVHSCCNASYEVVQADAGKEARPSVKDSRAYAPHSGLPLFRLPFLCVPLLLPVLICNYLIGFARHNNHNLSAEGEISGDLGMLHQQLNVFVA